jgi:hypothetical protein
MEVCFRPSICDKKHSSNAYSFLPNTLITRRYVSNGLRISKLHKRGLTLSFSNCLLGQSVPISSSHCISILYCWRKWLRASKPEIQQNLRDHNQQRRIHHQFSHSPSPIRPAKDEPQVIQHPRKMGFKPWPYTKEQSGEKSQHSIPCILCFLLRIQSLAEEVMHMCAAQNQKFNLLMWSLTIKYSYLHMHVHMGPYRFNLWTKVVGTHTSWEPIGSTFKLGWEASTLYVPAKATQRAYNPCLATTTR